MRRSRKKTVKWGIIGVGDVCEVKSAPAMNKVPHSRLVAVMRRNAVKAEDYAKRHGIEKWYDNADSLINDPDVNTIYIATPPSAHKEYTLKAAAAGKDVYVEKPMALNYKECCDMIDACEHHGVNLYVAYYRRALPNFLKVKSLIDEGVIGDLRFVDISILKTPSPDVIAKDENIWRVNPTIAGGGYFYDLASHQLDYLDFILGPVKSVKGYAANQMGLYQAEDIVVGAFEFKNGVRGIGKWCFSTARESEEDLLRIVGSKGEIRMSCFGDSKVDLIIEGKGKHYYSFSLPYHIQQPLIDQVVQDIISGAGCVSTGVSAARTNLILEEMIK